MLCFVGMNKMKKPKNSKKIDIQNTINQCLGEDEEILMAEGFENAFLGVATQFNSKFAVYDRAKCIEILAKDMTHEEAEEYFEFNVAGAWMGVNTPAFMCFEKD